MASTWPPRPAANVVEAPPLPPVAVTFNAVIPAGTT